MEKRVCCIVGLAPNTRMAFLHEAPGTEIWTVNNAFKCFTSEQLAKFTGWFQIHPKEEWEANNLAELQEYRDFLNGLTIPVWMDDVHPDYRNSRRYPLEEVIEDIGYDYFTSSIAYMVALAIHQRFNEIRMYGVEMIYGTEYVHERPCVEFHLGIAHARGIELTFPEASTLLRGPLYGRQVNVPSSLIKNTMAGWARKREDSKAKWNESIGMFDALSRLAADRPEDEPIKKMLAEADHAVAVNRASYNAFSGGCQALEDVLIDALRPETDQGRNMRRLKGEHMEPDYFDPLMFRNMVDSVNHPAAALGSREG